jgi:hypothetical protein
VYEQTTRRDGHKVRTYSRYVGPLDPQNRTARASKVNTTILSKADIAACLHTKEFDRFLAMGATGRFPLASLPTPLKDRRLTFKRREVFLSAETKAKIAKRHPEVDLTAYQAIQHMLEHGERVRDKQTRALVIFQKRDGQWWRLAIKATRHGEPYILTYHRSNERQYMNAKRLP